MSNLIVDVNGRRKAFSLEPLPFIGGLTVVSTMTCSPTVIARRFTFVIRLVAYAANLICLTTLTAHRPPELVTRSISSFN
jgi:hypothetical protein